MSDKIYIIIVLYFPSDQNIVNIIELCKFNYCVVVDNTPDKENDFFKKKTEGFNKLPVYIPLMENAGIAKAQNIGIKEAKKGGAEFILFLDQDSILPFNFIQLLFSEYKEIANKNIKLAAIGPSIINKDTGMLYKTHDNSIGNYAMTSVLISSGMLASIETLDDVGYLDENLFIDFVDFEWCWRAQTKGYICFRSKNIVINHKLGLKTKKIFNYTVVISAPMRYYYRYRNYLILCHKSYVPKVWKIKEALKHIFFFFYIPLISEKPIHIWMNMIKGISEGMKVIFQ